MFIYFKETSWTLLKISRNLFRGDPFVVAFDCFSVFAERKGILVISSDAEIISFKLTVTGDSQRPLKLEDIARIKDVDGKLGE